MTQTVKTDVDGHCPFCGLAVSVHWGEPPDDPGHLFHALPMCRQYESMTADEFVSAVIAGKHKN